MFRKGVLAMDVESLIRLTMLLVVAHLLAMEFIAWINKESFSTVFRRSWYQVACNSLSLLAGATLGYFL